MNEANEAARAEPVESWMCMIGRWMVNSSYIDCALPVAISTYKFSFVTLIFFFGI